MRYVLFGIFPGQPATTGGSAYATADEAKNALKSLGPSSAGEIWYVVDTQTLRVRAFRRPTLAEIPDPTEVTV